MCLMIFLKNFSVIIPELFYNSKFTIIPAAEGGGDNNCLFYTKISVKELTLILLQFVVNIEI